MAEIVRQQIQRRGVVFTHYSNGTTECGLALVSGYFQDVPSDIDAIEIYADGTEKWIKDTNK